MKLIYFCSEFPGISHTFIQREVETLRESGFEISTVSVNPPRYPEKMRASDKHLATETVYLKQTPLNKTLLTLVLLALQMPIRIIRMAWASTFLAMLKGPRSLKKALGYFVEAALLVHVAQQRNARHIHVHFANPAATVALIASRCGAVAYSLSIHGPDVFYNVDSNMLREKLAGATFIRCISHYCRSQLCRLMPHRDWSKLHIVRCGIDPENFSPRPVPGNDIFKLLCLGRLTANKGQHVLIDACIRLKEAALPFQLTFAGDGEDRSFLEHHASALGLTTVVHFTGAVDQDRVKALYESADIFVLPSFAEGLPVVLMEAMAMEIPVISTCITGIPELVDSEKNGILIPPGNPEMLFEKIKLLMHQPGLRRSLGKQARNTVVAEYDLADNCRRLADIFKRELSIK